MLSEKQHQHFDTFGFLVLPKVFTPEEIETLAAEFDRLAVPLLSGESASRGTICFDLLERGSHLEGLLGDERIAGIARNLLGPDAFCQQNTAQAHAGDEPWRSAFGWDVRIPTGRQDARENMEFAAHYSPGVRLTIGAGRGRCRLPSGDCRLAPGAVPRSTLDSVLGDRPRRTRPVVAGGVERIVRSR